MRPRAGRAGARPSSRRSGRGRSDTGASVRAKSPRPERDQRRARAGSTGLSAGQAEAARGSPAAPRERACAIGTTCTPYSAAGPCGPDEQAQVLPTDAQRRPDAWHAGDDTAPQPGWPPAPPPSAGRAQHRESTRARRRALPRSRVRRASERRRSQRSTRGQTRLRSSARMPRPAPGGGGAGLLREQRPARKSRPRARARPRRAADARLAARARRTSAHQEQPKRRRRPAAPRARRSRATASVWNRMLTRRQRDCPPASSVLPAIGRQPRENSSRAREPVTRGRSAPACCAPLPARHSAVHEARSWRSSPAGRGPVVASPHAARGPVVRGAGSRASVPAPARAGFSAHQAHVVEREAVRRVFSMGLYAAQARRNTAAGARRSQAARRVGPGPRLFAQKKPSRRAAISSANALQS
jgi:hypothetical protein